MNIDQPQLTVPAFSRRLSLVSSAPDLNLHHNAGPAPSFCSSAPPGSDRDRPQEFATAAPLFARDASKADTFHPRLRRAASVGESVVQGWRWANAVLLGYGASRRGATHPKAQPDTRAQWLGRAALAQGLVGHGLRLSGLAIGALAGVTVGFAASVGLAAISSSDRARAAMRSRAGGPVSIGIMVGSSVGAIAGAQLGQRFGLAVAAAARFVVGTAPVWLVQSLYVGALRGIEQLLTPSAQTA